MRVRLHSLKPAKGSSKKRKRIGCGIGSGHGKTSTKGRVRYTVVNLEALNRFEPGTLVDKQAMKERGLIKHLYDKVKVLGKGKLNSPLKVKADAFSRTAREEIVKRGGEVVLSD